jgi:hypothetical protein
MQPATGCLVTASISTPLIADVPGLYELETGRWGWAALVSTMTSAANSGITRRSTNMRRLFRRAICLMCLSVAPSAIFAQTATK